ncbi:hypothetical protein BKA69DRAFT_1129730 [Paraphysoderma sedebokerense]|nr:hypothetical protein BKA69DRAFT_1129730 [Paraphysoderma sedebokerense]
MYSQNLVDNISLDLQKIENALSEMSNKDLIGLIENCGYGCPSSLSGGRKRKDYIDRVARSLHFLPRRLFRYVVSIDIGHKNLAYVVYDCEDRLILKWRLVSLDGSTANLPDLSQSVRRIFREMTENLSLQQVMFVIEKQPRCGYTLISAQFHVLAEASEEITSAVMAAFKLRHGADCSNRGYKHRKKAAVKMASDWLSSSIESLPLIMFETFEEALNFMSCKKKDDMADCLLQLLAFLEFIEKRYEYIMGMLK